MKQLNIVMFFLFVATGQLLATKPGEQLSGANAAPAEQMVIVPEVDYKGMQGQLASLKAQNTALQAEQEKIRTGLLQLFSKDCALSGGGPIDLTDPITKTKVAKMTTEDLFALVVHEANDMYKINAAMWKKLNSSSPVPSEGSIAGPSAEEFAHTMELLKKLGIQTSPK